MDARSWVKDCDKNETAKSENLEKILDQEILFPAHQQKIIVNLFNEEKVD